MTPVSKKHLEKDLDTELNKLLVNTFSNLSFSESQNLINSIFTSTEIQMLKKRLGYFFLNNMGLSHDEIAKTLKTTRQTVYRFSLQSKVVLLEGNKTLFDKTKSTSNKSNLLDIIKAINKIDISRSTMRKKISRF